IRSRALSRRWRRPGRASRPAGSRPAPSATEPVAAAEHHLADRRGFRRHTRLSPTRTAPHVPLEVSVPVPAPNRRPLQRGYRPSFDTDLSDGTVSSNPLSSSGASYKPRDPTGLDEIHRLSPQRPRRLSVQAVDERADRDRPRKFSNTW